MNSMHDMPFGACLLADGGVRFRLWAPAAQSVDLSLENPPGADMQLPMPRLADGWFQLETPQAAVGSLYRFAIDGGLRVPDPASRANPQDVHGSSQVVDPGAFNWQDGDWRGRPWSEAVIYELHVGAFTAEGSFAAAMQHLDYLADLGVTAIELMPVADFPGTRNWGYDGVLLFAPDSSYGTPEQLKALVQAAHARGLMVLLDVVYNHFGPDGNFLQHYAPQFFNEQQHTPWGAAINFDGDGSRIVRDFYIHNTLYWLEEYHFDGLRFDAVHAIVDHSRPNILEELAARVQAGPGRNRHIHLILENDNNAARYLQPGGFTAQWNDDIHHALHLLLTGEDDGYYADYADQPIRHLARCLAEGFAFQGEPSAFRNGRPRGEPSRDLPSGAFINFNQTHDQIGNRAYGERIGMLASEQRLQAGLALLLLAPAPPMLFMGEEFAAVTPFQYFCDFHDELAAAVTEGRRSEFAGFAAFADPAAQARIPDPNAAVTFLCSKLHWACLQLPQHQDSLDFYRHLLALRHTHLVPRLPALGDSGEFALLGAAGLRVSWRMSDGARLTLLANMGNEPVVAALHIAGQAFYISQADLPEALAAGTMPAWCVAWFLEEGQS
jgi:1,4-alpha-glucan branching enzyme/maltooligosyltrehalose trehalohydrolase